MAFTAIPNTSIDADSPLDTTLMTYLRDNDDYLKARFNITAGHNHDGTTDSGAPVSIPDNSITGAKMVNLTITEAKIADLVITSIKIANGSVTDAKLNFAVASQNFAAGSGVTVVTINKYSHLIGCAIGGGNGSTIDVISAGYATGINIARIERIRVNVTGSDGCSAHWDYHA